MALVMCAISRGMHIDGSKENLCHEMGEILQTFENDPSHEFTECEKKTFLIVQVELSKDELENMRNKYIPMPDPEPPQLVPGKKIIIDLKGIKADALVDMQEFRAVELDASVKAEIAASPMTEKIAASEMVGG